MGLKLLVTKEKAMTTFFLQTKYTGFATVVRYDRTVLCTNGSIRIKAFTRTCCQTFLPSHTIPNLVMTTGLAPVA